jgi:hypothetical protein
VRASRFVGRERAANGNVVVESHESRFDDMIRSQWACLRALSFGMHGNGRIYSHRTYSGEKETRVNHQHLHGRRCVDSGDIGEGQEKRSTGQGDMVCHARRCLCDVLCVLLLFRDSAVPSSIPILRACCFPLWANRSCAGIALLFLLSPYRTPQPTVCHSFRLKHKP